MGAKASHFVLMLPSTTPCGVSFDGLSPVATTSVTRSVTLPGIPVAGLPVTPDIFLAPAGLVSAVLVQVGWGSAASNEE